MLNVECSQRSLWNLELGTWNLELGFSDWAESRNHLPQPRRVGGVGLMWSDFLMNIACKYVVTFLMSLALANFQSRCQGAEQAPVNLAERIRVLEAEDPGVLPIDQSDRFSYSILKQAASAGVSVTSSSRV